jgi:hypothetical protein
MPRDQKLAELTEFRCSDRKEVAWKAVDAKRIGKDLGVRYVPEGSAQSSASRVGANAAHKPGTGAELCADQMDADRADLLEDRERVDHCSGDFAEAGLQKSDAAPPSLLPLVSQSSWAVAPGSPIGRATWKMVPHAVPGDAHRRPR